MLGFRKTGNDDNFNRGAGSGGSGKNGKNEKQKGGCGGHETLRKN